MPEKAFLMAQKSRIRKRKRRRVMRTRKEAMRMS